MTFNSNQPRVPAGGSAGGEWAGGNNSRDLSGRSSGQALRPSSLTNGKNTVTNLKSLGGGHSGSYLATDSHGSQGVYKPVLETSQRMKGFDNPHQREAAAYEIDKALGLGLVPPTQVVGGPKGPGSFQQFISNANTVRSMGSDSISIDDKIKLSVLDVVTGNNDRSLDNILVDGNGHLHAIDNAATFSASPERGGRVATPGKSVWAKDMPDELPQSIQSSLRQFVSGESIIRSRLAGKLTGAEIDNTFARVRALLKYKDRFKDVLNNTYAAAHDPELLNLITGR